MSEYENILRKLGSFGAFQRRAFILVSMFETPLAWAMLTPILLNRKPDWYCPNWLALQENLLPNSTEPELVKSINSYESLEMYQYMTNTSTIHLPSDSNVCPNGRVCPSIHFKGDINSIVSQWKLICDKEYVADTITSIQMAGVLCGAVLTGQLADLFGRRNILFIEHAVLVIMWFCSAFAGTWMVYAGLRFVIGALIGGVLVVNFVLPLELVTPEWRTFCGCIGLWAVGLMALAGWGFYIRDWQYLIIATSCSSVFILLSWWFVPESPRWLLSKGQIKKAERILTKMAHYNKKPVPDFSRLRQYAESERMEQERQRKYSYWHLFTSCTMGKNTLILMYGWFVSSSVYYGMNFNTRSLTGNLYLNLFFSGLVEIPALLFVVLVHNRLGRRLTVSLLMFIAGLFSFSILILDLTGLNEKSPYLTVTFAMIGKAGISGGWAALQVFSAELFPTVIRNTMSRSSFVWAKPLGVAPSMMWPVKVVKLPLVYCDCDNAWNIGVASCSFCARIGAIVAPQVVFQGTKEGQAALPFTVFGIIALICSGSVWLLPETRGIPLPDELIIVKPPRSPQSANSENNEDEGDGAESVPLTDLRDAEANHDEARI